MMSRMKNEIRLIQNHSDFTSQRTFSISIIKSNPILTYKKNILCVFIESYGTYKWLCGQNPSFVVIKVVHIDTTQLWRIKGYGNSNITRLNSVKEQGVTAGLILHTRQNLWLVSRLGQVVSV